MAATGRTFREALPAPTSTDGSWTCWRGDGWAVLANPGGITVQVFANFTAAQARQASPELCGALEAAAEQMEPGLRAVPEPRAADDEQMREQA